MLDIFHRETFHRHGNLAEEIDLESIFPQRRAVHATEYFLSGDYPKSSWDRLNWTSQKNQHSHKTKIDGDCQIENLCVVLNPSDLKTFRIEFVGEQPNTEKETSPASVKVGFHNFKFLSVDDFSFSKNNAHLKTLKVSKRTYSLQTNPNASAK